DQRNGDAQVFAERWTAADRSFVAADDDAVDLPFGELLTDSSDGATDFTQEVPLSALDLAGIRQANRAEEENFLMRWTDEVRLFMKRIHDERDLFGIDLRGAAREGGSRAPANFDTAGFDLKRFANLAGFRHARGIECESENLIRCLGVAGERDVVECC